MKAYNLIYNGEQVNNFPLKLEELQNIWGKDITKKTSNGALINVPYNKCKIIEVTLV